MADSSEAGNFLHIDGWVTPRLEEILRRALTIVSDRGDDYVGVEHVVLSLLQDPGSVPLVAWGDQTLTPDQWRVAVERQLANFPNQTRPKAQVPTITCQRNQDMPAPPEATDEHE